MNSEREYSDRVQRAQRAFGEWGMCMVRIRVRPSSGVADNGGGSTGDGMIVSAMIFV